MPGKGKTQNGVEVESWDDRAGFGYVYFTDGTRVGWTSNEGVWECNKNASWGPTTHKHLATAEKFLRGEGKLTVDEWKRINDRECSKCGGRVEISATIIRCRECGNSTFNPFSKQEPNWGDPQKPIVENELD